MEKQMILAMFDFRLHTEAGFMPLKAALHGVNVQEAAWIPEQGNHSIWGMVRHLIFWNERMVSQLNGEILSDKTLIDNDQTFQLPDILNEAAWKKDQQHLVDLLECFKEKVSQMDDPKLQLPADDLGRPLSEVASYMVLHDVYHIGQIAMLRTLQGIAR